MATPLKPITAVPTGVSFGNAWNMVAPYLWIIIIFFSIPVGIFIVLWIWKSAQKKDPFKEAFEVKKNQCKMFRKSGINKVFVMNQRDGLTLMGEYEGQANDEGGYTDIMFSRIKFKLLGRILWKVFFPMRPILSIVLKRYWIVRCNNNPKFETIEKYKDKKTGKLKTKKKSVTVPTVMLTESNQGIVIHAMGLQLTDYFTYPIIEDKKGLAIPDAHINYLKERESILVNTLREQTTDFSNIMRQAINMNPSLRYVVKTEGKTLPDSS